MATPQGDWEGGGSQAVFMGEGRKASDDGRERRSTLLKAPPSQLDQRSGSVREVRQMHLVR